MLLEEYHPPLRFVCGRCGACGYRDVRALLRHRGQTEEHKQAGCLGYEPSESDGHSRPWTPTWRRECDGTAARQRQGRPDSRIPGAHHTGLRSRMTKVGITGHKERGEWTL